MPSGGKGFGFLMMAKGRVLAAEHSIVPGKQAVVRLTFSVRVLGLDSQLPVESELEAM